MKKIHRYQVFNHALQLHPNLVTTKIHRLLLLVKKKLAMKVACTNRKSSSSNHQPCRIIIKRSSCISLDIYLCCYIHLPQSFPSKQASNPVVFPAICLHWFYPDQPSLATTVEGGLRAICSWKRRAWKGERTVDSFAILVWKSESKTERQRQTERERERCIHACAKETEEETRRLLLQELGEKVGKDAQQSVGKSSFAHRWSSSS
jgi:hypothetical protein